MTATELAVVLHSLRAITNAAVALPQTQTGATDLITRHVENITDILGHTHTAASHAPAPKGKKKRGAATVTPTDATPTDGQAPLPIPPA